MWSPESDGNAESSDGNAESSDGNAESSRAVMVFLSAAMNGRISFITDILTATDSEGDTARYDLLTAAQTDGNAIMHVAARNGQTNCRKEFEVSITQEQKRFLLQLTVMSLASQHCPTKVAQYLLGLADSDTKLEMSMATNRYGRIALHIAVLNGFADVVNVVSAYLSRHELCQLLQLQDGRSPIFEATAQSFALILQRLLGSIEPAERLWLLPTPRDSFRASQQQILSIHNSGGDRTVASLVSDEGNRNIIRCLSNNDTQALLHFKDTNGHSTIDTSQRDPFRSSEYNFVQNNKSKQCNDQVYGVDHRGNKDGKSSNSSLPINENIDEALTSGLATMKAGMEVNVSNADEKPLQRIFTWIKECLCAVENLFLLNNSVKQKSRADSPEISTLESSNQGSNNTDAVTTGLRNDATSLPSSEYSPADNKTPPTAEKATPEDPAIEHQISAYTVDVTEQTQKTCPTTDNAVERDSRKQEKESQQNTDGDGGFPSHEDAMEVQNGVEVEDAMEVQDAVEVQHAVEVQDGIENDANKSLPHEEDTQLSQKFQALANVAPGGHPTVVGEQETHTTATNTSSDSAEVSDNEDIQELLVEILDKHGVQEFRVSHGATKDSREITIYSDILQDSTKIALNNAAANSGYCLVIKELPRSRSTSTQPNVFDWVILYLGPHVSDSAFVFAKLDGNDIQPLSAVHGIMQGSDMRLYESPKKYYLMTTAHSLLHKEQIKEAYERHRDPQSATSKDILHNFSCSRYCMKVATESSSDATVDVLSYPRHLYQYFVPKGIAFEESMAKDVVMIEIDPRVIDEEKLTLRPRFQGHEASSTLPHCMSLPTNQNNEIVEISSRKELEKLYYTRIIINGKTGLLLRPDIVSSRGKYALGLMFHFKLDGNASMEHGECGSFLCLDDGESDRRKILGMFVGQYRDDPKSPGRYMAMILGGNWKYANVERSLYLKDISLLQHQQQSPPLELSCSLKFDQPQSKDSGFSNTMQDLSLVGSYH